MSKKKVAFKITTSISLLLTIPAFSSQLPFDVNRFYTEVVQQLKASNFREPFRRGLHLYSPSGNQIIKALVTQSNSTLFRIDLLQTGKKKTSPQSISTLFQQAKETPTGVVLCIDGLACLTQSKEDKHIIDQIWKECEACFQSYPHIFIIVTCNDCSRINKKLRKWFTCIKVPTVSTLQIVAQEPAPPIPVRVTPPVVPVTPIPSEPVPQKPLQKPVQIIIPFEQHHGWNVIKGIAGLGIAIGSLSLNEKSKKLPKDSLVVNVKDNPPLVMTPLEVEGQKKGEIDPEETEVKPEPPTKTSWLSRLRPCVPKILTTGALLFDEATQWKKVIFHAPFTDYNTEELPTKLQNELKKYTVLVENSDREPCGVNSVIVIGKNWLASSMWESLNVSSFTVAHQVAHIEHNDPNTLPVVNATLILAVPFILHAYTKVSQRLFDATLERLENHETAYQIVETVQSLHNTVVANPLTQVIVTYALKAAYSRRIEGRANTRALELTELKRPAIQVVNRVLQESTKKRAAKEKNWAETIRSHIQRLSLFNPHVDSIPVPPPETFELQELRSL